jgi:malate synthase
MRAYTNLLVQTCHKRGAHAMGGMAAYIPNRKNPEINEIALAKVRDDKLRESGDGFDGTWVAHPDLVPVALEVFHHALGDKPHQKTPSEDIHVRARAIDFASLARSPNSATAQYRRGDVRQILAAAPAVAIHNLMEDTPPGSRAQVWRWIARSAVSDRRKVTGCTAPAAR